MLKLCRIYLFLYVVTNKILADQPSNCGDWESFNDEKCYKIIDSTQLKNFDDAKNTCYQLEGSSLATIRSQDEQHFLFNLLNNINNIVNDVWIGIELTLNSYKWVDSSALNYTNWANGNPINESGYDCVQLTLTEPYNGQWFNKPCVKRNVVVCEKMQNWMFSYLQKIVMEMRETIANITDQLDIRDKELDYYKSELKNVLTNSSTGCSRSDDWIKCGVYVDFRTNKRQVIAIPKLLNEKFLTQGNASNVCSKYNATLVSIESPEKQLFIEKFIQSNTTRIWTSGYCSADNIWRWINGNLLGYTNWATGKPDNGYPIEPCLEFNFNGNYQWNDIPCSYGSFLALCEYNLEN